MASFSMKIAGMELDRDNRVTMLETTRVPYIVPKFYELWSTNG